MATMKEVMDRAARQCAVTPPTNWINATTLTIVELRDDFLLETVDELLDRVDWPPSIGGVATFTTGVEDALFDLPSDFLRMKRDPLAVYESTKTRRAAIPVNTEGQWTYLNDIGTAAQHRFYRVFGYPGQYDIEFYQPLNAGDSVTVSYVSNVWLKKGGTAGNSSEWLDETDIPLLPRRLLELGVIWRFRKRKGLPFEDVLAEYEMRLSRAGNDANLYRTISGADVLGDDYKPMRVPVPDFIPSS